VLLLICFNFICVSKVFCPPICICKPCGLGYAVLVACAMMLITEEQEESCFLGDVRMNSVIVMQALVRQKYQQRTATCLLRYVRYIV